MNLIEKKRIAISGNSLLTNKLRAAQTPFIVALMNALTAVQRLLFEKLEESRLKNPAYSMRAFSKRLKISPSTLSRIFNGERNVSRPFVQKLCTQLMLDPQQRSELMRSFPVRKKYKPSVEKPDHLYFQLPVDQFRMIGEWYHFGILSLMKTKNFSSEPEWIARRLGISEKEAFNALARLERLSMIKKNASGEWIRTRPKIRTTDDIPSTSLQKAHHQNMTLATDALTRVPVELRDFTSVTMPTDPQLLSSAKEIIRKFQDDLCALLESKPGTEVYRFCTQLFPLTQIQEKENRK